MLHHKLTSTAWRGSVADAHYTVPFDHNRSTIQETQSASDHTHAPPLGGVLRPVCRTGILFGRRDRAGVDMVSLPQPQAAS